MRRKRAKSTILMPAAAKAGAAFVTTKSSLRLQQNLNFIWLLTFAWVIGSQLQLFSLASSDQAAALAQEVTGSTTTSRLYFDVLNTVGAISSTDNIQVKAKKIVSPLVPTVLSPSVIATSSTLLSTEEQPNKNSNLLATTSDSNMYGLSPSMWLLYETKTSFKTSRSYSDAKRVSEDISFSTSIENSPTPTVPTATTTLVINTTKSTLKLPLSSSTVSINYWPIKAHGFSTSSPLSSSTMAGVVTPSTLLSSSLTSFFDKERLRTFRSKHHHEHHWGPFFEEPLNSATSDGNFLSTAHLFAEAVLNCRVGMLKDKTVMWVRRTKEKVSLLTVGNATYSGDPRIRIKFQYPNNWRLFINPTHKEDAGIYMCQVSTHPPRVFITNLTVLEPPLRMIDEQERDVNDRYYKLGSTVDLQCQVSRSYLQKERTSVLNSMHVNTKLNAFSSVGPNELNLASNLNKTLLKVPSQSLEKQFTSFITWTKDEEMLPESIAMRISANDKWLNSRISINDAKLSDSGNYSCSLGKLFKVIVQVQVLTGELPAAVQHNAAKTFTEMSNWIQFFIVIYYAVLYISCSLSKSTFPV